MRFASFLLLAIPALALANIKRHTISACPGGEVAAGRVCTASNEAGMCCPEDWSCNVNSTGSFCTEDTTSDTSTVTLTPSGGFTTSTSSISTSGNATVSAGATTSGTVTIGVNATTSGNATVSVGATVSGSVSVNASATTSEGTTITGGTTISNNATEVNSGTDLPAPTGTAPPNSALRVAAPALSALLAAAIGVTLL